MSATASEPLPTGDDPDGTDPLGTDPDAAVVTRGLTKRFRGGQVAVDHLDLNVPRGSVFGFLGPNGSGKTTTIRMLMGLVAPTSGGVRVLGQDIPGSARSVLPRVGALIEGPALYPFLNGWDNLVRFDSADPTADPATRRERIGAALDRVGLTAAKGKKARAYSLGMKQRLGVAAALLRPRELLVLDEPTNGLDPQGTREIRILVRELAQDGTTVFLSSHLLAEVEQVCTHAGVMSRGELVMQGTVADLRAGTTARLRVSTPDADRAALVLAARGVTDVRSSGDTVDGDPGTLPVEDLCAALVREDIRVRGFTVDRASLEDAFVALTGEGFDVAQ